MKRKHFLIMIAAVLLCGLLLILIPCFRDHEDTARFALPEVSEVTFEELLCAPYVTEGVWSFYNQWTIQYADKRAGGDPMQSNSDNEIIDDLKKILEGEKLHTYIPEGKVHNYDKHVKDLLWDKEERLYIQVVAGTLPPLKINLGEVSPTHFRVYVLDETRCYFTIGYRAEGEINSTHYVFYTDDKALIEDLFAFAETIINEKAS